MIDLVFYYLGMAVFAWFFLGALIAMAALAWETLPGLVNRLQWKTTRTNPRITA